MKVAIIGAGFTGLAAAYELSKRGIDVIVFEKEKVPGGLAIGFKEKDWDWPLEKHYHHIFVSDYSIRKLARQVGHRIIFIRPTTSVFLEGRKYQLDSLLSLLTFERLSFLSRFRVGATLLYLKLNPFWRGLESISSKDFLRGTMGGPVWRLLWQPLFEKKFGKDYVDRIPASWFWARIKKRSVSLGYPKKGFESLARSIENYSRNRGAKFLYGAGIFEISKTKNKFLVKTEDGKSLSFDKVIFTAPSYLFTKMVKGLPETYKENLLKLKGLGAVNLVLTLKRKFLKDGTYWLNINERNFPFLAVVEQTNFINPKCYSGQKIIYIGNYLPSQHEYFSKSAKELFDFFYPFLKKINSDFQKSWVRKAFVFKTPFAQPVVTLNYSKIMPRVKTPIKGLFLANIQQVYPWDRGINYAVELGQKAAKYAGK